MRKTILSKLFFMSLFLSFVGVNSYAEEVVLCLNETDKYVDMVNGRDNCIEGEHQTVLNRSDLAEKKAFTPLANFKENSKCDGEGSITEIGFDENQNGSLDQNEIVSKGGTCNPTVAENEE